MNTPGVFKFYARGMNAPDVVCYVRGMNKPGNIMFYVRIMR